MANGISAIGGSAAIKGAMSALRATALGLITVAVIQLIPAAIKSKWAAAAAIASFLMIAVFNIDTAYVILTFLVLGIASAVVGSRRAIRALDTKGEQNAGSAPAVSDGEEGGERE